MKVTPKRNLLGKQCLLLKFTSPEVAGGETCIDVATRALVSLNKLYVQYPEKTVIAVTSFNTINAVAIEMNNLSSHLATYRETNLPKLNLGNGDLVLLETSRQLSFSNTQVVSHIKHEEIH